MGVTCKVPELRFSEFSGEWVEKRLGDIYSFYSTNSFSRDNLNYENKNVRNIHYGDIHTKFSTLFKLEKEDVPFVNKDIKLENIKDENYCQVGDLVIADASEDYADIGKTIELINLNNEKILAGLHTFLARPNKHKMALGYAGYLLQSWKVRWQVMRKAQGTKVLSLSTKRLANVILTIPSKPEQEKIASFLSAVDSRIEQLTKKEQLLREYKKGVMQKIFSQEIRFKDDDGSAFGAWVEKRLGDVAIKKSSNISANTIKDNIGDYIIYGAAGILKLVNFYEEENDYVSIVKDGAGVGRIFYCKGKSSVLGTMDIIKPKTNLNTYFLYCLLENINFVKYVSGSTIPHIYFKDYSNERCNLPPLKEQEKIASFLSSIDEKIEQTSKALKLTKEFKKALLQQMFV